MKRASERGVTLIVGLIMVMLITLIVVHSFNLSSSNLRSVQNVQVREEAIASANQALERMVSGNFTTTTGTTTYTVDIDNDNTPDYSVAVAQPTCVRAAISSAGRESDVDLPLPSNNYYNTDWELDATVTHAATGTAVRVREGVRVRLSQTQKNIACK
jgi:Tfp pilus assembly protein PilX